MFCPPAKSSRENSWKPGATWSSTFITWTTASSKTRQKQRKKDRKLREIQTPGFTDIASDAAYYDAVCWAYTYELIGGTSETTFSPDDALTREQVCTVMARFAALEEITLLKVVEPDQFQDSLYIDDYARSGVTACPDGRHRQGL